ncbi:MAG: hypothetical protein JO197_19040 [Acidobacteria bacterium]|nr:hypothetical protein [Acidobacteriota bacterium]MBV9477096.1 hypothetical protein [Acidobacteriota bacterium]
MSLTFVIGTAADVFGEALARAVESALAPHFAVPASHAQGAYESEPVDATGWRRLQERVLRTLDVAPQLTTIDAYQAVYVPEAHAQIEHLPVANAADPLQVGSLPALIDELQRFAASASLPTDDVELMQLAAHYLEGDDADRDLDVQTYVQLMLTAKQASARGQALWVVT